MDNTMDPQVGQGYGNRSIGQPRAQIGSGMGGYGGMGGGLGGFEQILQSILASGDNQSANAIMPMLMPMLMEQMMKQNMPQDPFEKDQLTANAEARYYNALDASGGVETDYTRHLKSQLDELTGFTGEVSGKTSLHSAIKEQMLAAQQDAIDTQDLDTWRQYQNLLESAEQDPSIYETWYNKPTWGERFDSLGKTNVAGHVLAGAGTGAGIGATAGLMGGPLAPVTSAIGAVGGGTIGTIGGLISGLRGLWDTEGIQMGRDYDGYGAP